MSPWIWLLIAYVIGSYFPVTKILGVVKSKV